ncbi:MAG: hypothetical protein NZ108_06285, partial [Bacteroidia bacterium]|nr:hypothetical protein [Bacteroidia bacterium]
MRTITRNSFLFGTLFLYGCAAHYQPTSVFHPQLTQKKEVCVNVSGNGLAVDGKIAYAVSNDFGLAVALQNDLRKFSYGEMMAGYYQSPQPKFRWDCWAGVGIGRFFSNPDLPRIQVMDSAVEEPSFTKVFVQPGIGFSGKTAEYALACRIAYLNQNQPVP